MNAIFRGRGWLVLLVGVLIFCCAVLTMVQMMGLLHMTDRNAAREVGMNACGPIFLVIGLVWWYWGVALQKRDGYSHTFLFIPVQFFGVLAFTWAVINLFGFGVVQARRYFERQKVAQETQAGKAALPHFATQKEAELYAMQQFPELAIPGSPFNKRFLALQRQFKAANAPLLQDPSWPVQLAIQTDELMKHKEIPGLEEASR